MAMPKDDIQHIHGEINNINDKKLLDRAEEIALYTGSNRKTIFVSPNKGSHKNPNLADRLDNVFRATFSKRKIIKDPI